NRVDYPREGLAEWYLSGPLGLEQGFTLAAPPPCRARGGRGVVITLRGGGLVASLADGGKTAVLRDGAGRAALGYSDLYVVDAADKEVPASLAAGPEGLAIHLDDEGAVYPVSVDPLVWVAQGALAHGDGSSNDEFGHAVSVSGDTALVGAPEH